MTNPAKKYISAIICTLSLLCVSLPNYASIPTTDFSLSSLATIGIIQNTDIDNNKITIQYQQAGETLTNTFELRYKEQLAQLKTGDKIKFIIEDRAGKTTVVYLEKQ